MTIRTRILLPGLLALCMTLAATEKVQAATDVSLQINLGRSNQWVGVPNTQVREMRDRDRSDFDVFQYGRRYYAYNHMNHRWYMSRRENGRYMAISNRSVPRELRRIPRDHWRNYPTAWEQSGRGSYRSDYGSDYGSNYGRDYGRDYSSNNGSDDSYFQVSFGSSPQWSTIDGTNIQMVYGSDRPNYDVFRYGGTYYVYNGDRWYSSRSESGRFTMINEQSVPTEFSRVPRQQWRRYPATWGNNGRGNSRGDDNRRDDDRRGDNNGRWDRHDGN